MPKFTVTGDVDPFLHVSLARGEKIFCESDAMVMMEDTLRIKGQARGGLGQALLRRFANDESIFQQEIEAVEGDGDCLLAPALPGGIEILELAGGAAYTLADGSFVAAESSVAIRSRLNNAGGALFGGTGGFLVMEATGHGRLAVSGFGSLYTLDVAPERDMVIDNNHAVAWSSALQYEIGAARSGGGGMLGTLINAYTSGEGLVLRFRGRGKVVVCSRNRELFRAGSSGAASA
jgi:uncharacterized protein (TIGR00266 family)